LSASPHLARLGSSSASLTVEQVELVDSDDEVDYADAEMGEALVEPGRAFITLLQTTDGLEPTEGLEPADELEAADEPLRVAHLDLGQLDAVAAPSPVPEPGYEPLSTPALGAAEAGSMAERHLRV